MSEETHRVLIDVARSKYKVARREEFNNSQKGELSNHIFESASEEKSSVIIRYDEWTDDLGGELFTGFPSQVFYKLVEDWALREGFEVDRLEHDENITGLKIYGWAE